MKIEHIDIIKVCIENICKNYNVLADLHITEPLQSRAFHDILTVFVDIHTCSSIGFCNTEIKDLLETGIKSNKDYKKLRSCVRIKLISAIRSLHDLTEESLRNLGVRICSED